MRVTAARWFLPIVVIVSLVAGLLIGRVSGGLGGAGNLSQIAEQRGLTADEAEGALKAFTAPGKYDEYVMVSSSGQSGNLYLVGVPSMRLLKTIPVFTPESWSGYGQGADWSEKILDEGSSDMQPPHGGVFVTPNTEYVHISSMSPTPQTPDGYAPLDQYKEEYRGISSWLSIDPASGRVDLDQTV